MAIREYRCACKLTQEKILPTDQTPPSTIPCPRCGEAALFVPFSRTGIVVSTFSNAPIDLVIGADADSKWQMYHDRQEDRNRVRKETGSLGLTEEANGEYSPISESSKSLREAGIVARAAGCPQDVEMTY